MTLHDQIVRGLERLGFQRDHDLQRRHDKRTVFIDHRRPCCQLYVGRAGALRGGVNFVESIPLVGLKRLALNVGLSDKSLDKESV